MQRIMSLVRTASTIACLPRYLTVPNQFSSNSSFFSTFQNIVPMYKLLMPHVPLMNHSCSFKVKGRVKRRCKSCYFVIRDERLYVICPQYPRHKQMAMKPKPLNTWVLTHASQSKVRPW